MRSDRLFNYGNGVPCTRFPGNDACYEATKWQIRNWNWKWNWDENLNLLRANEINTSSRSGACVCATSRRWHSVWLSVCWALRKLSASNRSLHFHLRYVHAHGARFHSYCVAPSVSPSCGTVDVDIRQNVNARRIELNMLLCRTRSLDFRRRLQRRIGLLVAL